MDLLSIREVKHGFAILCPSCRNAIFSSSACSLQQGYFFDIDATFPPDRRILQPQRRYQGWGRTWEGEAQPQHLPTGSGELSHLLGNGRGWIFQHSLTLFFLCLCLCKLKTSKTPAHRIRHQSKLISYRWNSQSFYDLFGCFFQLGNQCDLFHT